ncbi:MULTISPECIES: VOC family protein [unclassified Pseudomonas]|uniref:VOC family protein n=1 Tax=unclassified Pseudomonas TaxID=196821 RepID=UPI0024489EAE|nr:MULTISPECIES: VOC family protein [unclassified Pseudomonas]MDG9923942.1 VOC family protein [Pseudomonas sp. GD04045]MDH0035071.1 VOC family protein [Pseudomonas sp. GD04019]
MGNLNTTEIKAFVPAKDFERSKAFYQDLGFRMASDGHGVAYFHHGNSSFLLQDFYVREQAENFVMHLLVEDVDAWHRHVSESGLAERYGVRMGDLVDQPWKMREFVLFDPSGVLWRIAQNI